MEEVLKNKLKKLFELSLRGCGGEKDNAERLLYSLLEKHGLYIDDLLQEEIEIWWVDPGKNELHIRLLTQVVYAVTGSAEGYRNKGIPGHHGIKCTKSQIVEIELKFSIYKKDLDETLSLAFQAFLIKNNIYPSGIEKDLSEFSQKEIEDNMKACLMLDAVKKSRIINRIEHHESNSNNKINY